ncbi:helix-turn-helix transcriptional regulator [uncultured Pseudoflavonifractor sp.]|nr:helix-turn-helix transcriptional regulator [uncultured Pseudoflavonifractor sp.]
MELKLGNKIRQLRLQKGVTQDILARTLNVSYQTVSKWENGVSQS